MKNRLCCNRTQPAPAINYFPVLAVGVLLGALACSPGVAWAGDAPQWMHAAAATPVPAHDEKTDAVLLYSERNFTVLSPDKTRLTVRRVYKILRPGGRDYGEVETFSNPHRKITSMRGWCIPAEGKDYEVKDKEAIEMAVPKIEGSELMTDVRYKVLRIPAADPGNVIGYEYEIEEQPLVLEDIWSFQTSTPVRESHYRLQIPPGWEFKSFWLNHAEVPPVQTGGGERQWVVNDVKGIRREQEMPPLAGVAGQMVILFFPPGGVPANGFTNWQQMGTWYSNLTIGRRDASPEIKQKVASVTASSATALARMQAIAQFVQHDIRYVAIELGIGGLQPHPAADVFSHRYGDCKDKATLMASMLHEIGVESYYVPINDARGSVAKDSPAGVPFNHVILAIRLPDNVTDPSLIAISRFPELGRILFFDPTNELTPFGEISGNLQGNYGLLVAPAAAQLVELPIQPPASNSIQRTGTFTLDAAGNLQGDVKEMRVGDRAWAERWAQRAVTKDADRIKPIESLLANSLPSFHITKASLVNLQLTNQPFAFTYSFLTEDYAKAAGDLLLVRPRILGIKALALLETKEPRQFPIEFPGPAHDTDQFDITVPAGYVVDDLPPAVDLDYSFASYHSKTQVIGNTIRYTRTFEIKELSVPVSKADDLKKFYRVIATDERNTAVLKASK